MRRNGRTGIVVELEGFVQCFGLSLCFLLLIPVHVDLPVGGRRQGDPVDLSSVVVAVGTTEDHLTALLTVAVRE